MIKYPPDCVNEAQKLSFLYSLQEKLRVWHNTQCSGKTAEFARQFRDQQFYPKMRSLSLEIGNNIETASAAKYWAVNGTNISAGTVVYPKTLNQTNEGSKLSFLYALAEYQRKQRKQADDAVEDEIGLVIKDAQKGSYWSPTVADAK